MIGYTLLAAGLLSITPLAIAEAATTEPAATPPATAAEAPATTTAVTATTATEPALAPFSAKYRIYVDHIPMPITATLLLEPAPGEDRYHMRFKADSWLLSNREESWFRWNDCQPRTERYVHEFNGLGQHRYHRMTFSWSPPQVTSESEDGKKETFAIPANALDELTSLLRARCVFSSGEWTYNAISVYGDDIRHSRYVVLTPETIDTPLGELKTLIVEKKRDRSDDDGRQTLFWVAPKLGYMVVKAVHTENALLHGKLIMTEYHGPRP